jgi:CRISPR type III-A-associated RAMP protein Csm5
MKSYKVSLTVVGPLHIGSGKRLERLDYILSGDKIYVVDSVKLFHGLKKLGLLSQFEREVLGSDRVNLSSFVRQNNLRPDEYKRWMSYSYSVARDTNVKNMQIMTFVKDAYNLPYVPGSSLKGAIRNAIMNTELAASDKYRAISTSVERSLNDRVSRKQYLQNEARQAERMFYTYNVEEGKRPAISNDIFKGLIVSDSKPLRQEDIILCGKVDAAPDGKSHRLNLLRECIKPGTVIEFTITIKEDVFKYSVNDIIAAVKAFYDKQVDCFLSSFQSIQTDRLKGNFLYLGGSSGFVSKTAVYSLFKDKKKALGTAAKILDTVDSKNKGVKVGRHLSDPSKYGVSPHIRKCTMYNGKLLDFGLCSVDFQPIG